MDFLFGENIVIDEEAFDNAIEEFEELSIKLQRFKENLEQMFNSLKNGFNTPAGTKFISSCERNLFEPLNQQEAVIMHIKENLSASKQAYESVFREYETLQSTINNAKK